MGTIYAIANQKGGVGKTTTAASLGASLAELGQSILLVDLDPQAALTISYGIDIDQLNVTVYHVLIEETTIETPILTTGIPRVDLVPSNLDLAGAEVDLIGEMGWDRTLTEALKLVQKKYDFIIIDCPPTLGVLTTNALVAAHLALVPMQCEYLALRALKQLQTIITKVQRKANPNLKVRILRTMYDSRTIHAREVFEEIASVGGDQVLASYVKRTIKFADAAAGGAPINLYAEDSEAAQSYRDLAQELQNHG